jgi:DNA helicase-2/ATP-dependent DNA helicase PcrA
LEEERRLCFVGITRAEERLMMTKAAYRTMRGLRERTVTSPFLNEIPRDAVEILDRTGIDYDQAASEARAFSGAHSQSDGPIFRKGQLVRHPSFGLGRIVELSEVGQNSRAIVDFNQSGRKTLILQYARLEAVG